MWDTVKDIASIVSDVATALAFIAVAAQLWIIRRQNVLEAYLDFNKSERDIWRIAIENPDVAPKLLAEVWKFVPGAGPGEELLFMSLLDNYWHAYMRQKAGFLSKRSWATFEGYILYVLTTERGQKLWKDLKQNFPDDFVEYFDVALDKRNRQDAMKMQSHSEQQPDK